MSHAPLRRVAALCLAAAALPLALPATAPAKKQDLKVMTRNLYLGADVIKLAVSKDRAELERNATEVFQTVKNNDFATRAKGLAADIAKTKPDVVGLQEATTWRTGPKDDPTPAADLVYDSTDSLLNELASLGLRYRVVAGRDWIDIEGPTADQDVRFTQRDAIIVRKGSKVKWGKSFKAGYTKHFDVQTCSECVGLAKQERGYVGVDGTLAGRKFRFVTTHLEAYDPDIAEAQAKQLMTTALKSKKRQSILVGDFNSDPSSSGGSDERHVERLPKAYQQIIKAGFVNPMPRRLTCCYKEDLRNPDASGLDEWLDHIMVRPRIRAVSSRVVGNKMSGGLWPSDHQGVAATLRLK